MSLTESAANSAAIAAQEAIEDAANAVFIANADAAIADAISMGKFRVYINSVKHMSFKDIFDYYTNLGYQIGMPTCTVGNQPAQLFGQFWIAFWENGGFLTCKCHAPCQVVILWTITP